MKKKRIFKRLLVFIAVLVGTLGICAVSGSIAHAATEDNTREFLIINEGYYSPVDSEPNFRYAPDGPLNIPFTFYREDPNSGEYKKFESIRLTYENGNTYVYFSTSATYMGPGSVMVASSVVGDWLTEVNIRIDKTQQITETAGYEFLNSNFGDMVDLRYLVSGNYEFNSGILDNPLGRVMYTTYSLRGYFSSPLEFTGQELYDLYGYELPAQHKYYINSFRSIRIDANASVINEFAFEVYIPAVNSYEFLEVHVSADDTIGYENARSVVFDGKQYIGGDLYRILNANGYFNAPVYVPSDEYTPTDLVFAVVDAPVRFLQSLMSFELFGMTFFLIFGSIITLAIGLWLIFKL